MYFSLNDTEKMSVVGSDHSARDKATPVPSRMSFYNTYLLTLWRWIVAYLLKYLQLFAICTSIVSKTFWEEVHVARILWGMPMGLHDQLGSLAEICGKIRSSCSSFFCGVERKSHITVRWSSAHVLCLFKFQSSECSEKFKSHDTCDSAHWWVYSIIKILDPLYISRAAVPLISAHMKENLKWMCDYWRMDSYTSVQNLSDTSDG